MPLCPSLPLGMWNDQGDEKAFMNYKHACMLSRVGLFVTLCTVDCQLLCPWDSPRQEYWSGLPFPPPRDLSDPGIELASPASSALAGRFSTTEPPGKPIKCCINLKKSLYLCLQPGQILPLGKMNVTWSLFPAGHEAMFLSS